MDKKEVWKDIPNYEGLYEASSLGRIRTHKNKITYTKHHGARHWKERVLKGRGNNKITGARVSLWKNGIVKDWLVARLVAITFLGYPVGDNNTVNHINGNRLDNRLDNIEWLSIGDNVRHAFETGLMPYKKVKLFNESEEHIFTSCVKASLFLGRNHNYVSLCFIRKRKCTSVENIKYDMVLLKRE